MNTEQDTLAPQALVFTEHAAEKVMELSSRQDASGSMLRVYIQGGGCSGFQYGFALENHHQQSQRHHDLWLRFLLRYLARIPYSVGWASQSEAQHF
jgi:hypothetical protein